MSNFQNKINKQEKGIWRYANFYDEFIKLENRLSLNSNESRDSVGAKHLQNVENLYFKREDKNECGSLKDRSLAYQVSLAYQNNKKELIISTSGNAGIAAAAYCQKARIKLYVFISPETEKAKIVEMQKYDPIIIRSKRAIRLANYLAAKYKIENLRPSANNSSIEGFKAIAFEIFEDLGEVEAIFTFITSGSSFIGIGRAYQYLLENKEIEKMPKLYAIQGSDESSIAGRLGIKNTRRQKEILKIIKLTGGKIISINNNEILKAKNILEENNIYTSLEGCASFAGVNSVIKKDKFNKIVCVLSGKLREEVGEINENGIYRAENFTEVDKIVSGIKYSINNRQIGPVFFVTPNPIYAIGLEKIIKNYFVICSQRSDIVQYLQKEKISVLCLDDDKIKNAGKILINEKVVEYIKDKSKNNVANIITFKPSPTIQRICKNNGFRYLGNSWKLNRDLEDKIKFIEVTEKLKISNANSKIIKLDKNNCSLDFSRNKKFVVQLPRGFSGNSTFFIEDKNSLDEIFKKYKNRKVKLSEYFKGETYTINACVIGSKTLISKPIFQITGLSSYNKNSFGTCGNDYIYPKKLKKEQRKEIFDCTKKVGDYIKELGYKGIFGLDFVVSSKKVNLIEINPRIIGSMSLFTKLQIQNDQIPFLSLSILEFIAPIGVKNDNFKEWDEKNSFNASQLMLRNTKNKPIKIIKSLKSGIYEIKKNKLIFKKGVYGADKKMKKNEFLIQCSAKGRVVSPDIEYANIQVSYGIMRNEKEFEHHFNFAIKIILKEIKIEIIKLSNTTM